MLRMAGTCIYSPTSFLIVNCTRASIVIFYCHSIILSHGVGPLTLTVEVSKTATHVFYHIFLVMGSSHTFMNYNSSGLHNRGLHTYWIGSLKLLKSSLC